MRPARPCCSTSGLSSLADMTGVRVRATMPEIATAPAFTKKESQPVDPLMDTVRQLAGEHDQMSASFLQRKLGIGYPRAARLYDKLKEEQELGPGGEVAGGNDGGGGGGGDGGAEIPKDEPEGGFTGR